MTTFTRLEIVGVLFPDVKRLRVVSTVGTNNMSSTFEATFNNEYGRRNDDFSIGQEIVIKADKTTNPAVTKIFTGLIEDISHRGTGNREIIIIRGRDFMSRLMDSMVEPEVYNTTEVSVIVKDLVDKYVVGVTVAGVIAPGNIFSISSIGGTQTYDVTTNTIDNISFAGVSVFDAIKRLAELSSSYFFIDVNKNLFFKNLSTVSSGQTLNNTNVWRATFRQSNKDLYNRIFVYGDRTLSGFRERFIGNGTGSVFTLQYKPHNTSITVAGSIKRGAVFELTNIPASGDQYLVDFDKAKIIFTSGTAAGFNIPPNTGSITINYDRATPIIKFTEDRPSAAEFGPRTKWIVDKNIRTSAHAKEVLVKELAKNLKPKTQGTINVQGLVTLTAGETVIVNLTNQNITNETFDILSVSYDFNVSNNEADRVMTVKVNKRISNITDTLKDIILSIRDIQAQDVIQAGVLSRLESSTESFGFKVSDFKIRTRGLGSSFILSHPVNGKMGSPAPSQQAPGSNVILGDARGAFTISVSGGD